MSCFFFQVTWRQKTVPVDYKEGEGLGLVGCWEEMGWERFNNKNHRNHKTWVKCSWSWPGSKRRASSPNLQLQFSKINENFYPRKAGLGWAGLRRWIPKVLQTFLTPHQLTGSWQACGRGSEIITINICYFGLVICIYSHALSSSKCQGSGFSDIFQKGKGFFFANLSFLICSKLKPELFSETSS